MRKTCRHFNAFLLPHDINLIGFCICSSSESIRLAEQEAQKIQAVIEEMGTSTASREFIGLKSMGMRCRARQYELFTTTVVEPVPHSSIKEVSPNKKTVYVTIHFSSYHLIHYSARIQSEFERRKPSEQCIGRCTCCRVSSSSLPCLSTRSIAFFYCTSASVYASPLFGLLSQ